MRRVKRRTARDFNHPISYAEWVMLTRWQPLIIGLSSGGAGLVLGWVGAVLAGHH